ncbi:MAG: hypothetical protein HY717_02085 [Planctomycetes bacterium]|nr:hypothetical protein [Planctomycetota bacterium]
MKKWLVLALVWFSGKALIAGPEELLAAGKMASGNVDGGLTWRLGGLGAGETAARTAVFFYGSGLPEARKILEAARRQGTEIPAVGAEAASPSKESPIWIDNGSTDFALQGDGAFYWEEARRQALRGPHGGQLSRIGWFLRYRAGGEERRAGARISSAPRLDQLAVLEPVRRLSGRMLSGKLASADRRLEISIHAWLGEGPMAFQRFDIVNLGEDPIDRLELSLYANLEAAHDHENDFALLAPETGVTAYDPKKKVLCCLAGLDPVASGWVGTWASEDRLISGDGLPVEEWGPLPDLEKFKPPLPSITTHHPGAPKVKNPVEPETRPLSAGEAQSGLARDWLFQAEGEPLRERARKEIGWARALAARFPAAAVQEALGELGKLEEALKSLPGASGTERESEKLYLAVREAKRRIAFANPALDFNALLFIDQPYPQGSEWQHQARHRNGFMAMPGGRLLVLEGLWPGGDLRKLSSLPPGSYWKSDLSFDGKKVAFCYKACDEEAFHLYEIGLEGSGLRQITSGPFDDLDPIYLPDGGFAFVTTRGQTYVRCMPYTHCNILARCEADGSNLRLISFNNEPDWHPILLPDGRIIFSRWEYTDKALWRIQSLWTVRPDGTQLEAFWGNQSVWPDHPTEARAIPGTNQVMFTGTAHHDHFAGSIGVIDHRLGLNYPHGLTKVTWEVPWPESGNGPAEKNHHPDYHSSGKFGAYKSPFPLTEDDFLVSARDGSGRFNLYLMDVRGNRELIYAGVFNCWYPIPIRPVAPPPAIPRRAEWPAEGSAPALGAFFSANVLEGVSEIPPERVKYLRILRSDFKTYTLWERDYRFEGPAVSIVQAESVKQIVGTVPIEKDGSVYFEAPAGVPLHFQLLDEEKRALHTMRSFTGLMPGETRGCNGCHEGQTAAPLNGAALALKRPPSRIEAPPWGDATINYERMVQPVLDRHCGRCHENGGDGQKALDLTLRPGEGIFKEPYVTLIRSGIAGVIQVENYDQRDPAAYKTYPPLKSLSAASKLIDCAASGRHYEVKVAGPELEQLIGWVDAMGPYRGLEDIRALDDPRCAEAPVVSRP